MLSSITQAVSTYVKSKHSWQADEYRLEDHDLSEDGEYLDIWVIHRDDEKRIHRGPGGGKSLSLYLDRKTHRVVKELHFQ